MSAVEQQQEISPETLAVMRHIVAVPPREKARKMPDPTGMTDEALVEEHRTRVAEKEEQANWPEPITHKLRSKKAITTGRLKVLEPVMAERGLEFTSAFGDQRPLDALSNEELVVRYQTLEAEYPSLRGGKRSSNTRARTRIREIFAERLTPVGSDDTDDDYEGDEQVMESETPTDEELTSIEGSESSGSEIEAHIPSDYGVDPNVED